jgi:hypothetical protein
MRNCGAYNKALKPTGYADSLAGALGAPSNYTNLRIQEPQ